jgi:hypothetical protein
MPTIKYFISNDLVDQTERFMLLKHGDERTLQWKESYTGTPSNDTGPIFTYLRSEFGKNLHLKSFV